jgi:ABC-type nitrate/sulfonate/bicarbonate transport system ATPase subunit
MSARSDVRLGTRPASPLEARRVLEVSGLAKTFAPGRGRPPLEVLRDVSFSARRGEFVTVIGPSGCGKSTLLSAIAGLAPIDAGTIHVEGRPVTGPGPERAVVFQNASLLPWRTIEANVAYGLELRGVSRSEIRDRVAEVLRLVGLAGFAQHLPREVSGGMQQRANLARALAVDPRLVLMDEPFGALDALTKEGLQDELSELAARTDRTTLFITHDIGEAVLLADQILVMGTAPGRIVRALTVPFERPRERSLIDGEEFKTLVGELRDLLRRPPADP